MDNATDRAACWVLVAAAALALALASLVSNLTTRAQMEGRAPHLLAVRLVLSRLCNSGTAWAGLMVLAGWFVAPAARRGAAAWLEPMLAASLAGEVALVVHYALGQLLGAYQADIWASNVYWFAGAVVCSPLGLVGSSARAGGPFGLAARLVVPAGAVAEPFVLHMFTPWAILPWPQRTSSVVVGCLLAGLGVTGAVLVLARGTKHAAPGAHGSGDGV